MIPEAPSSGTAAAAAIGTVKTEREAPPAPLPADGSAGPVEPGSAELGASEEGPIAEEALPPVLPFDDEPVPQAPIPIELAVGAVAAIGLLTSYFRPRGAASGLG